MKIKEIQNITKKEMLISYRSEYHGDVLIDHPRVLDLICKIEFSLELSPLGTKTVRIQFLEELDYPTIPLMRELKDLIQTMDRSGQLP
jgi:hypothetical protein